MSDTRIIIIPEGIYQYLLTHVFEKHVLAGIPSGELSYAADTHRILLNAQQVDFSKLGNAKLDITPSGIKLDLKPDAGGDVSS